MRLLLVEDEHDLGISIHNALTKRDYIAHLPHPKLSHNEKWSFGDLRLAIAT